jgi:hypothetical protein
MKCSRCDGSGLVTNSFNGEPDDCYKCGGSGWERSRNRKGQYMKEEAHAWRHEMASLYQEMVKELVEAQINVTVHLIAAISLLKRGGKKSAPSNKMFDQMIIDYEKSAEVGRKSITKAKKFIEVNR